MMGWQDLLPLAVVTLLFGLLYWRLPAFMQSGNFYLVFAVIITFSVQVVGVYLVFASLVIPAFALYNTRDKPLRKAFLLGVLGYITGLLLSLYFDLPRAQRLSGRWQLLQSCICYLGAENK